MIEKDLTKRQLYYYSKLIELMEPKESKSEKGNKFYSVVCAEWLAQLLVDRLSGKEIISHLVGPVVEGNGKEDFEICTFDELEILNNEIKHLAIYICLHPELTPSKSLQESDLL